MKTVSSALGLCLWGLSLSCVQQVPNPADCTNDETTCTSKGLVCDPRLRQCVAIDGCVTSAMCSSPSASTCADNQCSACTADAECSEWSRLRNATPKRSFCTQINQQATCAECRPGMGATDCPDPSSSICDNSLGLCRPCRTDRDCASRICRKLGDYPEVSPVPGLQTGQCVPSEQIAYVDQDNSGCQASGAASTKDKPFCQIATALATSKPYISLAPSKRLYPNITLNAPDKLVVLVGPHQDTRSYSYVERVTVNSGTLILNNLYLVPDVTSPQISCIGSKSSLFLVNSSLINVNQVPTRLIDATQDCGQITLDRMLISCSNAERSALLIGGTGAVTTNYRVVNSAIVSCGGSSTGADMYGVQINQKAAGYFGFNTVYGNYKGIVCKTPATQSVVNSIVTMNTAAQIDGCTFDPSSNILDSNKLDCPSPPFLQPISEKNDQNVVNKGVAPPAEQRVPVDYDGNPRPQGAGFDIGMQELK